MNAGDWTGFCPICAREVLFRVTGPWYRDDLLCSSCGSIPRERSVMVAIESVAPNWRALHIHESSPAPRGVSVRLQTECSRYVASQLFANTPLGSSRGGVRCEDLERQTFAAEQFDLVVTQDVMEHVFEPSAAHREIWRTLRPGGHHVHTTPIVKRFVKSRRRAERNKDGSIAHLFEPVYHTNPVDPQGSLVTFDYGHDLPELIAGWAPFDVEVRRFVDRHRGILGEMNDVIVCTKRVVHSGRSVVA